MISPQDLCIAIDCMGGDYAPSEIVKGAIIGAKRYDAKVLLVGDPQVIQRELEQLGDFITPGVRYEIVEATEVIDMEESPATAIRKKRGSSVVVASDCVAKGRAQGFVSAGNTGAAMAAALFNLGRIEGIDRPAIAVRMPSFTDRRSIIIDAGANADCIPEMLLQFARMGSIFCEQVLNIENPRIGLLNIGEEPSKGNAFSVSAYKLLEQQDEINFVGNVEGKHIFDGTADVIISDGFAGNIALKTAEGTAKMMLMMMKNAAKKSLKAKAGVLLLKSTLKDIHRQVADEESGGALLLGVKGICVIGHGGSNANAVQNAIRVAKEAIVKDVIGKIEMKVLEGCF